MSARTSVVQKAVDLIGPDNNRRAMCVTAVHVALSQIKATEPGLRRLFHSKSKDAKRAAARLRKAVDHVQDVLTDDPDLPVELCSIFPPGEKDFPDDTTDMMGKGETDRWLTLWLKRIDEVKHRKPSRFRFGAEMKLIAAERAYSLLQQFSRDISATEGSTFCKLAALLHGTPKANFHHPCRTIVAHWKKRSQ